MKKEGDKFLRSELCNMIDQGTEINNLDEILQFFQTNENDSLKTIPKSEIITEESNKND